MVRELKQDGDQNRIQNTRFLQQLMFPTLCSVTDMKVCTSKAREAEWWRLTQMVFFFQKKTYRIHLAAGQFKQYLARMMRQYSC